MTKQFETQSVAALTAQALEVKEVAGIPFLVLDGVQNTKSLERFLPKPQRRSVALKPQKSPSLPLANGC